MNYSVTWDNQQNQIPIIGLPYSTYCLLISDCSRNLLIASRLSIRYLLQLLPDTLLELRSLIFQRHIELLPSTRQIFIHLRIDLIQKIGMQFILHGLHRICFPKELCQLLFFFPYGKKTNRGVECI